jgi:hypothetical protein
MPSSGQRDQLWDTSTGGQLPDQLAGFGSFALPSEPLVIYSHLGAQRAQLVVAKVVREVAAQQQKLFRRWGESSPGQVASSLSFTKNAHNVQAGKQKDTPIIYPVSS